MYCSHKVAFNHLKHRKVRDELCRRVDEKQAGVGCFVWEPWGSLEFFIYFHSMLSC